ncbi:Asp-tRNA(Asn)/Glu-tRNA(Gln) amidotransferase subunit GatC [Bdellovibrio sp. SKB1291214]|uniref:Asp-tRNA(Asn)/Glu-tRNA(Gln) amidotransferase subunit GatC n=1 Tax=Bdellovibrio sp. SKB1291214 TaxID=1732569 RepID=UPI000B51BE87|nr:Asp-tRNA(Asn)/Glu-tRNA(Gln) amidotransferase subunit GatC [Bdellovibrio sp. SKB1291214]UYL10498.1 Asp-tRNA(Asn)/Glu-tRNA(Gln) amidotransferase subunit GatC [Bdellovibrio sp. SKB1291214]
MIDKKTIEHIAKLARLQITEAEANEFSQQMEKILQNFNKIENIDTTGIEPMITPTEIEAYWREDQVVQEYKPQDMVANAPERAGNLFKVPPVV